MIEKGEQVTPLIEAIERIPTYDSFGDTDEALTWVLERLSHYDPNGIRAWWTNPHEALGSATPETAWDVDPNAVIQLIASL